MALRHNGTVRSGKLKLAEKKFKKQQHLADFNLNGTYYLDGWIGLEELRDFLCEWGIFDS